MNAAEGSRHIVERRFVFPGWGTDEPAYGEWRQIGAWEGPAAYSTALEFARLEVARYAHPAEYRIVEMEVKDTFVREGDQRATSDHV